MLHHRLSTYALLATAGLALTPGCKPPTSSQIYEAGGTPAYWRASTVLGNNGQITVSRTIDTSTITAVSTSTFTMDDISFQIATAPDNNSAGSIQNFTANTYLPLRVGTDDLKFNVLFTVEDGTSQVCFVNGVWLDDTTNAVMCKTDAEVTSDQNELTRAQLERGCQALSIAPISNDGGSSGNGASGNGGASGNTVATATTGNYATYDATASHTACTCLNGQTRSVAYSDFYTSDDPLNDFNYQCQLNPVADSTANNQTMCDVLVQQFRNNAGPRVTEGADFCQCGPTALNFADPKYLSQPDLFRHDCTAAVNGTPTATQTGTASATNTGSSTGTGSGTGTSTDTSRLPATSSGTGTASGTGTNTGDGISGNGGGSGNGGASGN